MQELPKIVRQRLGKAEPGPHPDPDLLASFAENTLREGERGLVLAHLSLCGDCREIVALAQPAMETSAVLRIESSSWLRWPVLKWGAAVACVAVVGAAIGIYREQPAKYQAEVSSVQQSNSRDELKASAPAAKVAEPERRATKDEPSTSPVRRVGPLDTPAVVAAKPLEKIANAPASPASTASLDRAVNEVAKKEDVAAGKAKAATASEMSGAAAGNVSLMDRKAAAADVSLAPVMAPRWTLNADGTLQRSLDGGKTWTKIPVSSNAAFRVVAALGSDVWVGGAAGSLFHSVDAGEHWLQLKPNDGKRALASDITAIQFTDAAHGRVTTSTEEVWSTEDGGTTWQQLW